MTLEDAKKIILAGVPYGDVYPHGEQQHRCDLAEWYVRDNRVPYLARRERAIEPTGEVCINCGSSRLIQGGACKHCLDCGESGGCG